MRSIVTSEKKSAHPPQWLVVGYGNPLQSDDGIGRKAATALVALVKQNVSVLSVDQLTPELADDVSRAERVLFLDATRKGKAGEIRRVRVKRDPKVLVASISHQGSPSALLELTAKYFHREPEAWLMTLSGSCFEPGEAFSPEVRRAWPKYLREIVNFVNTL